MRYQIDITDDESAVITGLAQLIGARTKRDVIMEAIAVYRWAARQTAQGAEVVAVSEGHRSTIETPGLAMAREREAMPHGLAAARRLGVAE